MGALATAPHHVPVRVLTHIKKPASVRPSGCGPTPVTRVELSIFFTAASARDLGIPSASDSDVPCPAVLQITDPSQIVELVLDDDALEKLQALVPELSLDPQAQRRTVCKG